MIHLLLLLFFWFRAPGRPLMMLRNISRAMLIAASALVVANFGGVFAIQTTSVADAMLLFATAPLMAAFLGRLVLGERVRTATGVSALLAVVGIAIMVAGGSEQGALMGNLAALGAALGFAVFTLALRWGSGSDMLPSVLLAGLLTIALTALLSVSQDLSLTVPPQDLAIALALGVFQLGAGLVLYTLGSRSVPAAELTLLSLGEVLLSPFWVWLFLGETVGAYTLIGGSVLLLAIAANALSGLRRKPPLISAP